MRIRIIISLLFLGLICSNCNNRNSAELYDLKQLKAANGADSPVVCKIAVMAALTGTASVYGNSIKNGILLAADEINAGTANAKIRFELKIEDTAGNPDSALFVLKKLYNEGVSAILGPTLSAEMMVIGPEAEKLGLPILATSNTVKGVAQLGKYIFRDSIGEELAVPAAIKKAIEKFNYKTAALIFCADDLHTKYSAELMKETAEKMGMKIITVQSFNKNDQDFTTQLTKIKKAKPDVILCSSFSNEAMLILIAARKLGITQNFIGGNGLNSAKIIETARESANGVIVASPWFAGKVEDYAVDFINKYEKKYGIKPDQFAAQAYDGFSIIAAAVQRANNIDRAMIRAELSLTKDFRGALGTLSFDADGDVIMQPKVLIIKDGGYQILQ